jgi:hypothetical protein
MLALLASVSLGALQGGTSKSSSPPTVRRGPVRLSGNVLTDDDGPFIAFGASYFPAIYLERNEPDRLEQNLSALDGLTHIRIFGDVGGGVWSRRETRPDLPDYWAVVDRLFARLKRHRNLRAEIVAMAGSPYLTSAQARQTYVDRWVAFINAHLDQVISFEISNEGFGGNGKINVAELKALASKAQRATPAIVMSSDPSNTADACELYAGEGLKAVPWHLPRGMGPAPSGWARPARQPYGIVGQSDGPDKNCPGQLGPPFNDEPIGIQSSVVSETDPRHIVVEAVLAASAKFPLSNLHSGAGVYAQLVDAEHPLPGLSIARTGERKANLLDQPAFAPAVAGLIAAMRNLPPDLASWSKCSGSNDNPGCSPVKWAGGGGPLEGRCYFAERGADFAGACFGADILALPLVANKALSVDLRDPLDWRLVHHQELAAGARFLFDAKIDAYVMVGTLR